MSWRRRHEPAVYDEAKARLELAVEEVEEELDLPIGHHPEADELVAEEEALHPTPPVNTWPRRMTLSVMIGVGLGAAIIVVLKFVDGPAVGTVKTLAAAEASFSPTPTPAPTNTLSGLYVTLQYPGTYVDLQRVKSGATDLEDYLMSTKSVIVGGRSTLAVEVMPLPSNGLKDDPSYRYRSINPSLYTPSTVTMYGDEPATLMTKSDGTELTLFWPHHGYELTVSISSTQAGNASLAPTMQKVRDTARWKS
jgi:hypothetical protein